MSNNNINDNKEARSGVNLLLNKIIKTIDKVFSILCLILGISLFVSVVVTVILRYFLGITFVQSEAAITMIFIATTYLGVALGVREKDHIDIPFLYEKFSPKTQVVVDVIINLIIIAIMYIVYKYSLVWIGKVGNTFEPALHIKKKVFYDMVPISAAISIFYCCINILSVFVRIDDAECGYDKAEYDAEACKEAQKAIERDFRTERLIIKGTKKEGEGK